MGLRNQFGYDAGRNGFEPVALIEGPPQVGAEVVFVVPGHSRREEEEVRAPIPGQRLLPAPEPMVRDAFGVWRPMGRTE